MPPRHDTPGREAASPPGDAAALAEEGGLNLPLSSALSTREGQPPPRGQGLSVRSPRALLLICH